MDISTVSEPNSIKQRWFCNVNCTFFQIRLSVFHYLTKNYFVQPSSTELNYPFKLSFPRHHASPSFRLQAPEPSPGYSSFPSLPSPQLSITLQPGAPEAVWDWGGGGANIPGGSLSRGSDVMSKNVWGRGGGVQQKHLHHHHFYPLHGRPAERFSEWNINDQVERKLAWGPGTQPPEAQGF